MGVIQEMQAFKKRFYEGVSPKAFRIQVRSENALVELAQVLSHEKGIYIIDVSQAIDMHGNPLSTIFIPAEASSIFKSFSHSSEMQALIAATDSSRAFAEPTFEGVVAPAFETEEAQKRIRLLYWETQIRRIDEWLDGDKIEARGNAQSKRDALLSEGAMPLTPNDVADLVWNFVNTRQPGVFYIGYHGL
jgi:hypothetical protein